MINITTTMTYSNLFYHSDQSINHYSIVRPKVGNLSLPHVGITKTGENWN